MTFERTVRKYSRTESGKSWKKNADSFTVETVNRQFYENATSPETLRFFNGFMGGSCRAERTYTPYGYVPVRVTLVNPSRTEKTVETWRIFC